MGITVQYAITSWTAVSGLRAGEDDKITVEIADPDFVVPSIRVEVYVGHHLGAGLPNPANGRFEVVGLKPERHTVAGWMLGLWRLRRGDDLPLACAAA